MEIKLKDISNPLALKATLQNLADTIGTDTEALAAIAQVHNTLTGTEYTKTFTSLTDCSLTSGSSNLTGGYLYC